jgi:hypothetical protein
MRNYFFAAVAALALAGVASAQPQPARPLAPAAAAGLPVQPASGTTVISGGAGCTNCGTATGPVGRGFTMSHGGKAYCGPGGLCNNGCGSIKSTAAFQFGSCKQFFAPCGPAPLNAPWGQGFGCPRAYDSYSNH